MSDPNANVPRQTPDRLPQGLGIASTLCWICGTLLILSQVSVAVTAASGTETGPFLASAAAVLLGGAYVYGGYLLRKRRRVGGWLAGVVAVAVTALQVTELSTVTIVGIAINAAIVGLLVMNWPVLRRASGTTGAEVSQAPTGTTAVTAGQGVRGILLLAALVAALFTVGWYAYMQRGAEDAKFKNFLRANTVLAPGQEPPPEAQAPSDVGLWVGGIATAALLIAGLVAPQTSRRKRCPFCAEDIAFEAKVCKHCGRDLPIAT